jgi:site-specific DNA recombinase
VVATELLDAAVWQEICRLLKDPARVLTEYQRRLTAVQADPRQLDLDRAERQIGKLRRAIDRLIDAYAEGLIAREELEPRLTDLRRRIIKLETEAADLHHAAEQVRSLQMVIGKLSLFADKVRERLDSADWSTKRDLIRTLVKRIEVDDTAVRVIFRVEPGPAGGIEPHRHLPHCPTRRHPASDADHRRNLPLVGQGDKCRIVIRPDYPVPLRGGRVSLAGTKQKRPRRGC